VLVNTELSEAEGIKMLGVVGGGPTRGPASGRGVGKKLGRIVFSKTTRNWKKAAESHISNIAGSGQVEKE